MHFPQMKKLSPSSKNLDTRETLNLSLKFLMIICTNLGELLQQSSTSAFLGKLQVLTSSKFYGGCSIRRMLTLYNFSGITNQQMRDSDAYKTYLAYATGATSPKMKRKFKKPDYPSKKRTLVTVKEEGPKLAKKDKPKKASAKAERSKGIELLSDVALLEEAQLQKALKRSKRETNIHQASGSSEGDSGDEANVQDDEDVQESYDEPQHTDGERTDSKNQETNDDEEESEDEFGAGNQVKDDAQATQKTDASIPTSSISSNYAAKFLNFDNIPPTNTEVISMIDINVQHEVPQTVITTPTLTIFLLLSSLYPTHQQIAPIPTPTTTEATTSTTAVPDSETLDALQLRVTNLEKDVKELNDVDNSIKVISTIQSEVLKVIKEYLGSSLDDAMYKVIQRNFADIMEHARKQQVPKETITSSDTTTLEEFDQKTTLFEIMTKSKSFNKSPKQRALYHALMDSILEDEDAMDEGVADKLKKRKPNDADKDEGPSAG
ncbi:hypothetical protein Tco_0604552 [Tanacetum coccineum]